jgi:PadR family transcriptional regulator AphA
MSLPHALLGLLAEKPASGYDMVKEFGISLGSVWPATQSQIYTELNRLADTGLAEVVAEGPRGRKEYALTPAGLAELRRWLTEARPHAERRNAAMLGVFFLGVLSHDEAKAYLADVESQAVAELAQLKDLESGIDWDDSPASLYGRLVLEWGLRITEVRRDWAQWATKRVARQGKQAAQQV